MPAIAFPSSPSLDDEYTFAGRTWAFDGIGWKIRQNATGFGTIYPGISKIWADEYPSVINIENNFYLIERTYV